MNGPSDATFSEFSRHPIAHASPSSEPAGLINGSFSIKKLFAIIFRKIHPLFSVDCGVVLIYDDQITVIKEAYISTYINETEQINAETLSEPSELTAMQKTIAEFSFPVIKNIEEWTAEENINHCLLNGDNQYK